MEAPKRAALPLINETAALAQVLEELREVKNEIKQLRSELHEVLARQGDKP